MARYAKQKTPQAVRNPFEPMLKTVEQMAVVSGIGENRLRQLMDNGELEFIQNGNRRLISEQAIWDYYNRAKTPARSVSGGCLYGDTREKSQKQAKQPRNFNRQIGHRLRCQCESLRERQAEKHC